MPEALTQIPPTTNTTPDPTENWVRGHQFGAWSSPVEDALFIDGALRSHSGELLDLYPEEVVLRALGISADQSSLLIDDSQPDTTKRILTAQLRDKKPTTDQEYDAQVAQRGLEQRQQITKIPTFDADSAIVAAKALQMTLRDTPPVHQPKAELVRLRAAMRTDPNERTAELLRAAYARDNEAEQALAIRRMATGILTDEHGPLGSIEGSRRVARDVELRKIRAVSSPQHTSRPSAYKRRRVDMNNLYDTDAPLRPRHESYSDYKRAADLRKPKAESVTVAREISAQPDTAAIPVSKRGIRAIFTKGTGQRRHPRARLKAA